MIDTWSLQYQTKGKTQVDLRNKGIIQKINEGWNNEIMGIKMHREKINHKKEFRECQLEEILIMRGWNYI